MHIFSKNKLGIRLVLASLLVSSVLSVFATGAQTYLSYRSQQSAAFSAVDELKGSTSATLAQGLWEFNLEITEAVLSGIVSSTYISALNLQTPTGYVRRLGPELDRAPDDAREVFYTTAQGATRPVGRLSVWVDQERIFAQVWSQFWTTLASNIIKAYLAALALLWVFDRMVTRHVRKIATHIHVEGSGAHRELTLDRPSTQAPDELDQVAKIFNRYAEQNRQQVLELKEEVSMRRIAEQRAKDALEARTMFFAVISHELRTPLNAMLGMFHLIEMRSDEGSDVHRNAVSGLNAGQSLLEMLTNTLETARLEAKAVEIKRTPVEIRTLAQRWCENTEASLTRRDKLANVQVRLQLADDLAPVYQLDGGRLSQVIGNLTDNAAKFTSKGDILIFVAPRPEGPGLRISVCDTGSGIRASERDKIFIRFKQVDHGLKRAHDGTGLGLSISKELTELMGGSIHVSEKPLYGYKTEFVVEIPATVDKEATHG